MMKISIKINFLDDKKKNDEEKKLDIIVKSEQKSLREALMTIMRFVLKNSTLKDFKI